MTATFASNNCEVVEGCAMAGTRRLLRFSTETRNIGTDDLVLGSPVNNPLYVFAACHGHYHFNGFARYSLLDTNDTLVAVGNKVGFCLEDISRWDPNAPTTARYTCANQGIQAGWADIYSSSLPCQYIDITTLPGGTYTLELTIDPDNHIAEANETNNSVRISVTIEPPCTGQPTNDAFSNCILISNRTFTATGSTDCATKQAGEPNHAGNSGDHSIWYCWTAPVTENNLFIDTLGSSFDTLLAVYTGSDVTNLQLIKSNDDIDAVVRQSRVKFNAIGGTAYRIAVDGYSNASGSASGIVVLNINPAWNDNFANCQPISGPAGTATGNNGAATKENNEPNHAGNSGGHSIWYCWTAPATTTATFDTLGSTFDTLLAVYTGSAVNALTPVASDNNSAGNGLSRLSFNTISNTVYRVAVDGFNGASGIVAINWNTTNLQPPTITVQPTVTEVVLGSNASLSVTAVGSSPLWYQWIHNGNPLTNGGSISGVNSATLSISNAQPADHGVYSVTVTNAAGSTNSQNANVIVTDPSRVIFVEESSAAPGSIANAPVLLTSHGDENTLAFSLVLDPTLLNSPTVALGADAQGGTLTVNTNELLSGRFGITVGLPGGQAFAEGVTEVAVVSFSVSASVTNSTNTVICFADSPVLRQNTSTNGNPIAGLYACGPVEIIVGYEADVAPLVSGNDIINNDDVMQVGRFISGLDSVMNGVQFQRVDSAPRSLLGNGVLSVADWVQAGRYAATSDAPVLAGGPASPMGGTPLLGSPNRIVQVVGAPLRRGSINDVSVEFVAQGDENALAFSVGFDTPLLSYKGFVGNAGSAGASVLANTNAIGGGQIGFALLKPAGAVFTPGVQQLFTLSFAVAASSSNATTAMTFGDWPLLREIPDANANSLSATYRNATLGFADFLSVSPGTNGTLTLTLQGVAGRDYVIEFSPDLQNWTSLTTNACAADGLMQYIDTQTSDEKRFYRAYLR